VKGWGRLLLFVGILLSRSAAADPLFELPAPGKLATGGGEDEPLVVGLLDVRVIGALAARDLATFPDRQLRLESRETELLMARAGARLDLGALPLSFVVRADPAELLREPAKGGVGTTLGAITDDLYLYYTPFRALGVLVGRARVPFSKLHQFDELDEPLVGAPFVVDRLAPDRRWGALLLGDLGALSYAAGFYEDRDELEPRAPADDPSQGGELLGVAHAEWTPIAPMMGSNPPGQIRGARGPLPTPRGDPWYDTPRVSLGMGELWRRRQEGSMRSDLSLSAQLKWRWAAGLAELICTDACRRDPTKLLGAYGQLMVTPTDRLALGVRLEWDGQVGEDGTWALSTSVAFHVTTDRRSKMALLGWIRRDGSSDPHYDGAVVLLQTSL
jgi:hypothetical protein